MCSYWLCCNFITMWSNYFMGFQNRISKWNNNQVVDRVVNRYKKPNWAKTELLIVDEVSMLSLKIFTIIDLIANV